MSCGHKHSDLRMQCEMQLPNDVPNHLCQFVMAICHCSSVATILQCDARMQYQHSMARFDVDTVKETEKNNTASQCHYAILKDT